MHCLLDDGCLVTCGFGDERGFTVSQNLSQATNAILTHLLMELKSGNIRRCESLGMTIEEVRQLSQLTVDDLHYLMQSSVSVLNLSINHDNFWIIVQQSRTEQKRMQRIDRALALGGSIELMQTYFGLSAAEVSARRRLKGIDTARGRTQAPDEEADAGIWTQWDASGLNSPDSHDALDVMMLAAELHNVSLTAVWTRVTTWCRERDRKGNKRGAV